MGNKIPSRYLARIGAKGGAQGRGPAKRRPKEHYVQAARKRWGPPKGGTSPAPAPKAPTPAPKPERVIERRKDRWQP